MTDLHHVKVQGVVARTQLNALRRQKPNDETLVLSIRVEYPCVRVCALVQREMKGSTRFPSSVLAPSI